MKVLSAAAMREADQRTIEEYGMPGLLLMETAASRVTEFIRSRFSRKGKILVFCGPGNNGGDGLAIARQLIKAGHDVLLFTTVKPGHYRGDAAVNEYYYRKTGLPILNLNREVGMNYFEQIIGDSILIVDALLGTGISRDVTGLTATVIAAINAASSPVLAVDIPSGVDADRGTILGSAVQADWTLTFAFPKKGLLLYPGAAKAGEIFVCDINIPGTIVQSENVELLTTEMIRPALAKRLADAHKGTMGRVLVAAGSPGMSGAAVLAAESALRSGAGLVYLAVPEEICAAVEAKTLEVIVLSLPAVDADREGLKSAEIIVNKARNCDAVCLGPGMSADKRTRNIVEKALQFSQVPLVLDAGALMAIKDDLQLLHLACRTPVLTPHPGEMARLSGLSTLQIQNNRINFAIDYARLWKSIIILKGANTVIASPATVASFNPTGSNKLATAGTGDLLSGMVASFMAQGMDNYDAACAGAFMHGLAGDLLTSERGHSAGDVLSNYSDAFTWIEKSSKIADGYPAIQRIKPLIDCF